jgi:hypothetical protein
MMLCSRDLQDASIQESDVMKRGVRDGKCVGGFVSRYYA